MAKIIVFQHVPYEPLGTLDALMRRQGHRIKYVNFGRVDDNFVDFKRYDALIVLGGPMNVGEAEQYPHLTKEINLIKDAIEQGLPILGICLGSQLIAAALGADVAPASEKEIGWYRLSKTQAGAVDSVTQHFADQEMIFQWHGWTFELPKACELLITGDSCRNQAFKYSTNVYGFQFHLEVEYALIDRWLKLPAHLQELGLDQAPQVIEKIRADTKSHLSRSVHLSQQVFGSFLSILPKDSRFVPHYSR